VDVHDEPGELLKLPRLHPVHREPPKLRPILTKKRKTCEEEDRTASLTPEIASTLEAPCLYFDTVRLLF
jgi:hypothetical protein